MDVNLQDALAKALGSEVTMVRPLCGGDINEAHAVTLSDGREVFAKSNQAAPPKLFAAEARGLRFLAAANALRTPRVLAVSPQDPSQDPSAPPFLVLEMLRSAKRSADFDERLGRGLAALHRSGAEAMAGHFGLDHESYIGTLPQPAGRAPKWASFYQTYRLDPQRRIATERGVISPRLSRGLDRLNARLPQLVGLSEPPARLHGDLWIGNIHVDEMGQPALIDPAVYVGHREVDLAMMRLFGGFSQRVFDAYDEVWPLLAGAAERVELYQLYFLLVHLNLFGKSYLSSCEACVARYVSCD